MFIKILIHNLYYLFTLINILFLLHIDFNLRNRIIYLSYKHMNTHNNNSNIIKKNIFLFLIKKEEK